VAGQHSRRSGQRVRNGDRSDLVSRATVPIQLGPVTLRNRVAHTSMTTEMLDNRRVSPTVIQYHVNRALGGVALTVTEPLGMAPHHATLARPQVWDDSDAGGFCRWAEAVERLDCRLLGRSRITGAAGTTADGHWTPSAPLCCPTT